MSQSNNPLLSDKALSRHKVNANLEVSGTMTVGGTISKTIILLLITVVTASVAWQIGLNEKLISIRPGMMIGSGIIGLIIVIALAFKPMIANILAPFYAFFEGIFLGIISAMYANMYDGIVMQAILLTLCVMAVMLILYMTKIIRVTDKLRSVIISATMGIFVFYLIGFALSFFNIQIPLIHGNGIFGIGFSLFVVGLAAFNLLLDFDFIEKGSQSNLPKNFEWYGAFGMLVTLIWLYIEILRLLSKLQRD